ncbi:MAG: FG-GAP repeat domain-containing protein, partial [Planctomycetota bacterium]
MVRKKTGRRFLVIVILTLGLVGCIPPDDNEDPLANPNLDAVFDTGGTEDPDSGTGTSGPGFLAINPGAVRVPLQTTMTFTAAGGEPPYQFSLVFPTSVGTLTPQGVYTAGSVAGTDRIRVTDAQNNFSDADVTLFDPAQELHPYRILCTDLNPPVSRVVVPQNTRVHFRIENGLAPDSFNVTNRSGGRPDGFKIQSRTGVWETGGTGADDGSVVDTIQVFDSSSPLNVAVLEIYVAQTALTIDASRALVPSSGSRLFTASGAGVGALTWSLAGNESGGVLSNTLGTSTTYTAGTQTRGIHGALDHLQLQDSFTPVPQVAQCRISVPGLSVAPAEAKVPPLGTITFQGLGGSGTMNWSILQNRSGSTSISGIGSTFTYTAGQGEGQDILELRDAVGGGLIRIPITVCAPVTNWSYQTVNGYFPQTGTIGEHCPLDMVVDDFNGDGVPDVAAPLSSSSRTRFSDKAGNQVSVLLGTQHGNLAATATKYTLSGAVGPWGIASGDFNADGHRDIAVTCISGNSVVVMFGDGTGGFPNGGTGSLAYLTVDLPDGLAPTGIAAYNLDRAGGEDLVVCDSLAGKVLVLLSRGGGPQAPPGGFEIIATLKVSDPVQGDGILPLCMGVAVANFDNDTTGTGTLTGNAPGGVGRVDIAVTDYAHDNVTIFPATGILSWDEINQRSFPVWANGGAASSRKPVGIAAGFFGGPGDTFPDIVVANNGVATPGLGISVLNNTGSQGALGFSPAVEYGHSCMNCRYYWDVLAYDLDNDGCDDIAATDRNVRPDMGLGGAISHIWGSGVIVWRGL